MEKWKKIIIMLLFIIICMQSYINIKLHNEIYNNNNYIRELSYLLVQTESKISPGDIAEKPISHLKNDVVTFGDLNRTQYRFLWFLFD